MEIQVQFAEPLTISSQDLPDKLRVTLQNTSLLFDVHGLPIEEGSRLERVIPS